MNRQRLGHIALKRGVPVSLMQFVFILSFSLLIIGSSVQGVGMNLYI